MSHEHDGDMAMSDMDEEELPAEASTTAEVNTATLSDMESFSGFDPLLAGTITGAQESCSHCMMHSQSGVNSPSAPIVVNVSTSHDIVPASSSVSASVPWPLTFVDVHDHGPPGLNGSRYILNSSFRI